jgi:hypothetical protein
MKESLNDKMAAIKQSQNEQLSRVVQGVNPYLNDSDPVTSVERGYWTEACGILVNALRARNAKNPTKYSVAGGQVQVKVFSDRITLNGRTVAYEDVVASVVPFDDIALWRGQGDRSVTNTELYMNQLAGLKQVDESSKKQSDDLLKLKVLAVELADKQKELEKRMVLLQLPWQIKLIVGAFLTFILVSATLYWM